MINGGVSWWWRDIGGTPAPRAPLPGDLTLDVCIVGAGYTGMWTAYYLKLAQPDLRVGVIEQSFAGFGASGRNGGWLTNSVTGDRSQYVARISPLALRNVGGLLGLPLPRVLGLPRRRMLTHLALGVLPAS